MSLDVCAFEHPSLLISTCCWSDSSYLKHAKCRGLYLSVLIWIHTHTQAQGTTGEQWFILWKELALDECKMRADDGRRWQNSEMASFSVCLVCVWDPRPLCWANTLLWQWTVSKQCNANTLCTNQALSHISALIVNRAKHISWTGPLVSQTDSLKHAIVQDAQTNRFTTWSEVSVSVFILFGRFNIQMTSLLLSLHIKRWKIMNKNRFLPDCFAQQCLLPDIISTGIEIWRKVNEKRKVNERNRWKKERNTRVKEKEKKKEKGMGKVSQENNTRIRK